MAKALTPIEEAKEEYFRKYKRDIEEVGKDQVVELDYPRPLLKTPANPPFLMKYKLVYETFQNSIEESYFWILNYLRHDVGFPIIEKITDIFAAAETSAFGGVVQQRLGLQQDKVSQFLGVVGKMVKEVFQLIRELRILDERLGYYTDSVNEEPKMSEPAEITLKGIFIDMAEGGSKNPASVYGMARELQFTTLPDLFFAIHPKTSDQVGDFVDGLEFNRAVRGVLKRKLYSFLRWKEETWKEMKHRKVMTLKYLRQHYDVIRLYLSWVKPYLRNIKRMQSDQRKSETPDIIAAFEGSMVEIEILARILPKGNKDYYGCMICTFDYRTRPAMNYHAEGYQRGPLHVGELTIRLRGYAWNEKDIDEYKKMKTLDDLELIGTIDSSIKSALDSMGDELRKYLDEAGGEMETRKEEEGEAGVQRMGMFEPFSSAFRGAGEVFSAFGAGKKKKPFKADIQRKETEKSAAKGTIKAFMWITYKNYKKAHKIISW